MNKACFHCKRIIVTCGILCATVCPSLLCGEDESREVQSVRNILTNVNYATYLEHVVTDASGRTTLAIAGALQKDTFYIQYANYSDTGGFSVDQRIFGRSFDNYWAVGPNIVKFAPVDDVSKTGESAILRQSVEQAEQLLFRVLRFGVPHLTDPATYSDDGLFRGDAGKYGMLTGRITEDSDQVIFTYQLTGQTNQTYRTFYPKDSFNDNGVPQKILRDMMRDGVVYPISSRRYIVCELGNASFLSTRGYVPSMFVTDDKPKELFMVSSNETYSVESDGTMLPLQRIMTTPESVARQSPVGVIGGLVAIIGVNCAVAFWLYSRARKKQT